MAKLLENIFRSVNIALVNELAILADRMGVDIWEVIDAASTKPYGFMRFEPGPGMGGHCLPVDPFYLTWRAREFHMSTEFIELAGKVNQQMPYYCVERIERALNDNLKPVKGSRLLILGASYKGASATSANPPRSESWSSSPIAAPSSPITIRTSPPCQSSDCRARASMVLLTPMRSSWSRPIPASTTRRWSTPASSSSTSAAPPGKCALRRRSGSDATSWRRPTRGARSDSGGGGSGPLSRALLTCLGIGLWLSDSGQRYTGRHPWPLVYDRAPIDERPDPRQVAG